MTRDTVNLAIAALLETLAEERSGALGPGTVPESYAYIGLQATLGLHLDDYQRIIGFCVEAKLLDRPIRDVIRITDAGRALVGEIEKARKAHAAGMGAGAKALDK